MKTEESGIADTDESEMPANDFACTYSENIPAILKKLNISLAFTSYQASRLVLLRTDGETLDVNYKTFERPMGLAVHEGGLTLGIFTQIINFQREDGLLPQIKQPLPDIEKDITAPRVLAKETDEERAVRLKREAEETAALTSQQKAAQEREQAEYRKLLEPVDERVDACFIARSSHFSGMINIHDIDWGDEGLWVVNSSFSCLATLDPDYSFVPRWKPFFISELVPEDRCHLNGMTLRDGKPAYVTTFSQYNEAGMWRKGDQFDGTLMDVETNTILVKGLAMPHSPRWYNNRVYYCNSGYGQICTYDPETGKNEVMAELPGFTRGMDFYGPILFVGTSRVRDTDVSKPAPLSQKYDATISGIWLINTDDGSVIGHIEFTGNVEQLYDVAVLPETSFPELIEPTHPRMRNHFSCTQLQPI